MPSSLPRTCQTCLLANSPCHLSLPRDNIHDNPLRNSSFYGKESPLFNIFLGLLVFSESYSIFRFLVTYLIKGSSYRCLLTSDKYILEILAPTFIKNFILLICQYQCCGAGAGNARSWNFWPEPELESVYWSFSSGS